MFPPMIISPSPRLTIAYLVINLDAGFARGARELLLISSMLVDMSRRGRSVCIVLKSDTRTAKDLNSIKFKLSGKLNPPVRR